MTKRVVRMVPLRRTWRLQDQFDRLALCHEALGKRAASCMRKVKFAFAKATLFFCSKCQQVTLSVGSCIDCCLPRNHRLKIAPCLAEKMEQQRLYAAEGQPRRRWNNRGCMPQKDNHAPIAVLNTTACQ